MTQPAATVGVTLPMLLKAMIDRDASDLHIRINTPPQLRLHGRVIGLRTNPLTPADTEALCFSVLTPEKQDVLRRDQELDFAFGVPGLARFRANFFYERGCVAGVIRQIPFRIMTLDELGAPPILCEVSRKPRGLVLITGPTGSGKSSTLAAMIDQINSERHGHIVTIEDPIEFVHQPKSCIVTHREVGADTKTFGSALRSVLRQDPDVVLVGELRDLETMEAALTLAETGHLTMATLHTNSAVQTINRIIDAFPAHQQGQIRAQLSFLIEAVVCQQLVPRISGGRALVTELLLPNHAVRNLIRENKLHQMYSAMQVGRARSSMHTMNQSLCELVNNRQVRPEDAIAISSDADELRKLLG